MSEELIPEEDRIVITEWEYDPVVKGFHPNMIYKDHRLADAISEFYERVLQPEDVELFSQNNNCIATSRKMYGAFFEKDLKHADTESK